MFDYCIDMAVESNTGGFYRSKTVKARKEHICCECYHPIEPGQRYESAWGKSDDSMWRLATCSVCLAVRNDLCQGGVIHGELWNEIERIYGLGYDTILEEDEKYPRGWDRWEGDDRAWSVYVKEQERIKKESERRLAEVRAQLQRNREEIAAIEVCKFLSAIGVINGWPV